MDTKKKMPPKSIREIHGKLQVLGDPERAKVLQRFFKTGPGEYAEGDIFVGIRVPEIRKLAEKYQVLPIPDVLQLLHSPIHEARVLALLILVRAHRYGDASLQKRTYEAYLENTRFINNWDLVDLSAEHIVGPQLRYWSRSQIRTLAASNWLWDRRIVIMATFHCIKKKEFSKTLYVSELLLKDSEDLIHKAVGWMLREVGKRDQRAEESFLKTHYKTMPRTMLRYAIEKFPEDLRQRYLKGEIQSNII